MIRQWSAYLLVLPLLPLWLAGCGQAIETANYVDNSIHKTKMAFNRLRDPNRHQPPPPEERDQVYCYRTLAWVDCYGNPQPGQANRYTGQANIPKLAYVEHPPGRIERPYSPLPEIEVRQVEPVAEPPKAEPSAMVLIEGERYSPDKLPDSESLKKAGDEKIKQEEEQLKLLDESPWLK
jgi:hypothetical protein